MKSITFPLLRINKLFLSSHNNMIRAKNKAPNLKEMCRVEIKEVNKIFFSLKEVANTQMIFEYRKFD